MPSHDHPAASPALSEVILVSATRSTQAEFVQTAWLARSLRRVASSASVRLRLFAENTRPLPECYNQATDESPDDAVLVFVHDDVFVDDWLLAQRLHEGLAQFDVVGVAARAGRLRQAGVRFDPRFDFHFYDLDFCRSASAAGLRLGTWPLAITHASSGESIQSASWEQGAQRYLQKWGD